MVEQLKELIVGGRTETGRDLAQDVARAASGLRELGCAPGDRVAVLLRNCREQLIITIAAQHLGAYPVQMNWHGQSAELEYVLQDCGARILVGHLDLLPAMGTGALRTVTVIAVAPDAELRRAYRMGDRQLEMRDGAHAWDQWLPRQSPSREPPAVPVDSIIYTSGTTGHPKGVRRLPATPEQLAITEQMRLQVFGIAGDSRVLVSAPIYHTAPHLFAIRAVRRAEALVLRPRFDAVEFLRDVERFHITHAYVVPTIFVRWLVMPEHERKRYDLSSLKFVLHAGGPCAPHLKEAMIDWLGPIIHEYYGSTEAGPSTFCTSFDSHRRPGTVGRAAVGVRIEIQGEDGKPLPAGEVGEICVRNDGYADFTYLNRENDRVALRRGDLLASGDLGYLDADGYLYLCDRKRDMVISGGVNIYPAEIEAAVLQLRQVADCAVFGIPDEEFGEALAALVQPHPGARIDPAAVSAHLATRLAAFKLPRLVEVRDALPRDESGKIKKRLLRDAYWTDAGRRI